MITGFCSTLEQKIIVLLPILRSKIWNKTIIDLRDLSHRRDLSCWRKAPTRKVSSM